MNSHCLHCCGTGEVKIYDPPKSDNLIYVIPCHCLKRKQVAVVNAEKEELIRQVDYWLHKLGKGIVFEGMIDQLNFQEQEAPATDAASVPEYDPDVVYRLLSTL